jgi:streptogramin lyase
VDNTNPDGVPRCVQLLDVDLEGSHAYGAAVDGNGYLWISTLGSGEVKKINTVNGQIVMSVNPGLNSYGIAIDQTNNVWYGNWSGGTTGVIRVNGATGAVNHFGRSVGDTGAGQTRGVAVDQDGNIWVAEWTHQTVSKFAPDGTHLAQYAVAGLGVNASGPLGMAIDFDNNIWAINYSSGHASKYDAAGNLLNVFSVGSSPYTYSDMTGYQLRTITLKHGTWTIDFDSGYDDAQWDTIEWSGSMGADDEIRVRARTAATQGALVSATWSPHHDADPAVAPPWTADISQEVPRGRWLQVEVTLTTDDEVSPAFTGLKVFWQR